MTEREKYHKLRSITAELSVEISDVLAAGITLDEIITAVINKYGCGSWKFSRTESRYDTCIMAIFEAID